VKQRSEQIKTTAKSEDNIGDTNREWLLNQIRHVLEIGIGRVTHSKTSPADRIKWSRIVIAAGQALNAVLRDVEIEDLKRQIEELQQLAGEQEVDEQGDDQESD